MVTHESDAWRLEDIVITIDVFEVQKALRDDGLYSLPCADEEMMLEILIGLIGPGQAA